MKDFIEVYPNALSDEFCDNVIDFYQQTNDDYKLSRTRKYNALDSDNEFIFLDSVSHNISRHMFNEFSDVFWNNCYTDYSAKYGIVPNLSTHQFYRDIKIQRTEPTEGYHIWHCEHDSRETGTRLLLVIAYLNTIEEGGETEFLYQSRRIKAEKGTIMICPSGFTHTHRGNPPLSATKYIMNGWIEFT